MDWLSTAGALFLVWLVLVFLFTPGINYHLARRTSVHDDDFLYTLQSTCQTSLHHGNRVAVFTNGPDFYPAMHDAIRQGVPLKGYMAWSLLDNLEWSLGYAKRFGITHVNFKTQERTIKDSGLLYAEVIKSNGGVL